MASDILSLAAMHCGFDVKKSEIHGMSQRGGSVFSHIRFGKKVWSPVISRGEADILLSLEEMETLRWISCANADSTVLTVQEQIKPAMVEEYPAGMDAELKALCRNLFLVDPAVMARQAGDKKYINVALLGIVADLIPVKETAWEQAIKSKVPAGTFEANWKAFQSGKLYYREITT